LYNNPPGAGTASVGARYRIKESLLRSFTELIKNHKFKVQLFLDEKEKKKYFIVNVPSEALKKDFFFTVVIEVSSEVNSYISFMNSPVRVASNNPAFVFIGYAYIADQSGFLIPQLKKRYDKKAFTSPKTRNPQEILGFDKSIWFAVTYIIKYELFSELVLKPEKYTEGKLLDAFDDFDDSMVGYEKQKRKQAEEERKEKEKLKDNKTKHVPGKNTVKKIKSSHIKTIKTTKTVRTIKTSSTRK
jgi:hypothetical protein